jgi:hypothetical protein
VLTWEGQLERWYPCSQKAAEGLIGIVRGDGYSRARKDMVRKKRGSPHPTSRKIKVHTIKEDKSFLLRNGQARSLATHTAKGAETIDNAINNKDISQHHGGAFT